MATSGPQGGAGKRRLGPKSSQQVQPSTAAVDEIESFKEPNSREVVTGLNDPVTFSHQSTLQVSGALLSILNFFTTKSPVHLLSLPNFQRPYAWTTKEVQRLLDEFLEGFETDPSQCRLLGPIVLGGLDRDNNYNLLILDGQQRITTLTIMISCFRSHAVRLKNSFSKKLSADDIETLDTMKFDCNRMMFSGPPADKKPFLVVDATLRYCFANYIQCKDPIPKLAAELSKMTSYSSVMEQRVCENLCTIDEWLSNILAKEKDPSKKVSKLRGLFDYIQSMFKMNVNEMINAPAENLLRNFFISLNESGLPLSPEDSLKVRIIGRAQGHRAADWAKANGDLSLFHEAFHVFARGLPGGYLDGFQAALRMYAAIEDMSSGNRAPDWVTTIREKAGTDKASDPRPAIQFIDDFLGLTSTYMRILKCQSSNPKVRTLFRLLAMVPPRMDDWQKLLVRLLKQWPDPKDELRIVRAVLRLVASQVLLGTQVRIVRTDLDHAIRCAKDRSLDGVLETIQERMKQGNLIKNKSVNARRGLDDWDRNETERDELLSKNRYKPDASYARFLAALYEYIMAPREAESWLPNDFNHRQSSDVTVCKLFTSEKKKKNEELDAALGNLLLITPTRQVADCAFPAVLSGRRRNDAAVEVIREVAGDAKSWTTEHIRKRGRLMTLKIVDWLREGEIQVDGPENPSEPLPSLMRTTSRRVAPSAGPAAKKRRTRGPVEEEEDTEDNDEE